MRGVRQLAISNDLVCTTNLPTRLASRGWRFNRDVFNIQVASIATFVYRSPAWALLARSRDRC